MVFSKHLWKKNFARLEGGDLTWFSVWSNISCKPSEKFGGVLWAISRVEVRGSFWRCDELLCDKLKIFVGCWETCSSPASWTSFTNLIEELDSFPRRALFEVLGVVVVDDLVVWPDLERFKDILGCAHGWRSKSFIFSVLWFYSISTLRHQYQQMVVG